MERVGGPAESTGYLIPEHWADVGGQTVDALKEFIGEATGVAHPTLVLELCDTVEDLRRIVFGILPM